MRTYAKPPLVTICGDEWIPIAPCPDDDRTFQTERVILRFARLSEPEFFIAKPGMMHAGWVVGVRQK